MDLPKLNHMLACYAVFLATGHTVAQRQIKASTIRNYLAASASFLQLFAGVPHRDARHDPFSHTTCQPINSVLQHVNKFEKIPDRVEPYTLAMQKALHSRINPTHLPFRDSRQTALFQWFGVALQGGNRRCEWCQLPKHRKLSTFELAPTGESRAFTLSDISFLSARMRAINLTTALRDRDSVQFAVVTYRWQKNGDHGERKTYTRNLSNTACDSVGHLLSICDRYVRLLGPSPPTDKPLAVYATSTGQVLHLTSDDATSLMRSLAKEVYDVTTPHGSRKWTCHSLRVGACCILWAMGHVGEFIQRALRWRSASWKDYIRDLTVQARAHNTAISNSWDLPAF